MPKTKAFIEKARAKHGDRYDYGKVIYTRAKDKVIITCNEHGDFEQMANNHLIGKGCARCSGLYRYTTLEWIAEAKKVHGDRYDYGKVDYVRNKEKVIITCRDHGDFEQLSDNHLRGCGCQKCSGNHRYSTDEWVTEAKKAHGDRYDYAKTVYTRTHDKVVITCEEHGDFEQSATHHRSGRGCPRCLFERDQPTSIYLMQMGAQVKIGISIDPDARLARLNRNNPKPAHIITTWTLEDFPAAHAIEQRIHHKLKIYHAGLTGFDGATEWFNTTPEHSEQVVKKLLFATMPNSATITNKATQMDLFT